MVDGLVADEAVKQHHSPCKANRWNPRSSRGLYRVWRGRFRTLPDRLQENPKPPVRIIAGILADASEYKDLESEPLRANLSEGSDHHALDFGVAMNHGAFWDDRSEDGRGFVISAQKNALMFFLTNLYTLLLMEGSVPALDIEAYDDLE